MFSEITFMDIVEFRRNKRKKNTKIDENQNLGSKVQKVERWPGRKKEDVKESKSN